MMRKLFALIFALALLANAVPAGATDAPPVDVDLSEMNDNINYAHMKQIVNDPESYAGKTICVKGKLSYSEATGLGMIILCDASGCCEIALPFSPADAMAYPDDYPPLYADIAVTGRLEIADDMGRPWLHFEDAQLSWDEGEG